MGSLVPRSDPPNRLLRRNTHRDAQTFNPPGAGGRQPERDSPDGAPGRFIGKPDRPVDTDRLFENAVPVVQTKSDVSTRIADAQSYVLHSQVERAFRLGMQRGGRDYEGDEQDPRRPSRVL
jgi:hypothetical protein